MSTIELFPTLEHCIETTARLEFNRLAGSYMESNKENAEIEAKLELLRCFLSTADFRTLRQQSEACLTAGKKVKFILSLHGTAVIHQMEEVP